MAFEDMPLQQGVQTQVVEIELGKEELEMEANMDAEEADAGPSGTNAPVTMENGTETANAVPVRELEMEAPEQYSRLALSQSISESQMHNLRRRMSSIDEEAVSVGRSQSMDEARSIQPITAEELKEQLGNTTLPERDLLLKEKITSAKNTPPVAKKQLHPVPPPLSCIPKVPSPLRHGESASTQVLMDSMPDYHEEMGMWARPKRFFGKRTLRSKAPEARSPTQPQTLPKPQEVKSIVPAMMRVPRPQKSGNTPTQMLDAMLAVPLPLVEAPMAGMPMAEMPVTEVPVADNGARIARDWSEEKSAARFFRRRSTRSAAQPQRVHGFLARSLRRDPSVAGQSSGQDLGSDPATEAIVTPNPQLGPTSSSSTVSTPTAIPELAPTAESIPAPAPSVSLESPAKPRTHVHFSGKAQCTLCTPDYIPPGSVPEMSSLQSGDNTSPTTPATVQRPAFSILQDVESRTSSFRRLKARDPVPLSQSSAEAGSGDESTAKDSAGTLPPAQFFRRHSLRPTPPCSPTELPGASHQVGELAAGESDTVAGTVVGDEEARQGSTGVKGPRWFFKRFSPRSKTKSPQDLPGQTCEAEVPPTAVEAGDGISNGVKAENDAPISAETKQRSSFFQRYALRVPPRSPLRPPPPFPERPQTAESLSPVSPITNPESVSETPAVHELAGADVEIGDETLNASPDVHEKNTAKPGLQYVRDPKKVVAYLIPLPKPILKTGVVDEEDIPQKFLIYTPPKPHLLKPSAPGGQQAASKDRKRSWVKRTLKEGKRHWVKRKMQEEVQKAQQYDGRTISLRGIHSKVTKGVVWVVRRIKTTDIVFLNRIERKEVSEIRLISPPSTYPTANTHGAFLTQLARTKHRALRHAVISTFLLPVTLIIDTLVIPIWPFGGLFEINAVWAYSSIKGYHTARSISRRLNTRSSRLGWFAGEKKGLRLTFEERQELKVLEWYVADWCHKTHPERFPSVGVPPSEGEVERCVGWVPAIRGVGEALNSVQEKGSGKQKRKWQDEEVQRAAFREDLRATAERAARSWGKSCEKHEKTAEEAATRWPSCS